MDFVIHRVSLDIHTTSSQVILRVKKRETARKIHITLREGGQPYQISSGCTANLSAIKPDGNSLFNHCEIKDNTIIYTFTEQTTSAVGQFDCEVMLNDGNGQIITAPRITIIVEEGLFLGDEIISMPEATALEDLISRATIATANAENVVGDIKSEFANALNGNAEGALVQVEDISPIEHTVGCRVRSRNLFNTLDDYKGYEHSYADGTLTVTGRYTNKYIRLEEGKTYTFSCKSSRTGVDGGGVYVRAYTEDQSGFVNLIAVLSTLSPTVTVTLPEGYPYLRISFYGYQEENGSGTATYTDIMLEEGAEATGYVPYVDPATVTVTRCGKNLLPYPYSTTGFNGTSVKLTVNADRSVTVTGTPTTDTQIDLAAELILPAGDYCIAGNGTNVRVRILGVDGTTRYSVNKFTVADGDKVRIYVVALANATIDYTFYPMLNVGTEALPYEDYTGQTYTPNADGSVDKMTSLYPYMAVFANSANTLISCEYTRDSNKVIKELYAYIDYLTSTVARISEVKLLAAKWIGNASPYSQVVSIAGITENSQVDLTPSVEQLSIFHEKDLAFVTENVEGVVTVYAVGQKPTNDYTMQVTITEVNA